MRTALALMAAVVLAGCLAPEALETQPARSSIGAAFSTLKCPFLLAPDPGHPLELCNVRATAHSGPANEVDIAMDPADPARLVLVAKAYNYTRLVGDALRGGVLTVYASTQDGGATWTEGYLQPLDDVLLPLPGLEVGATRDHASDPVVEFAPDGGVVAVVLRIGDFLDNSLPAYRSEDGGATFVEAGTAIAVAFTDKEWLASDPLTGNLYVATNADGGPFAIRSRDGGRTWDAPVTLPCCSFPSIAVGPGGAVYAAGLTGFGVALSRSDDEGQTWSAPIEVGPYANLGSVPPYNGHLFRTPQIPQMASSPAADSVHVVWGQQPEGTENPLCADLDLPVYSCIATPNDDVFIVSSLDGGATWTAPRRLNDDPTDLAFQFMPQVAVSPNGRDVHVAWLDQRHDPSGLLAEVYYAHSPDGGLTWEPNLRLSDAPFLTTLSHHQSLPGASVPPFLWNGIFVGDYIGVAASDDRAVVAFPDTRYGRADIFIATIV